MGSDYYSRAVIGVKASKYAKNKTAKYQVQKKTGLFSDRKSVFDENGKPIMNTKTAEYIEFLDKNYIGGERPINNIVFEDSYFRDYLKDNGLDWFSYDYGCVYENDVIGIEITECGSDGVALKHIPKLFTVTKKRLKKLGITEEPMLYASFYHSY